jgi:hypothetical protein
MARIRQYGAAVFVVLLVRVAGVYAQPPAARDFSNESLIGSYAAEEHGDGGVSTGLGIAHYDGTGNTTGRILVNAPGEGGARRILLFESEGVYPVNPDGTGTVTYTNTISPGEATTDTGDFVITGVTTAWMPRRGNLRVATELFAAQREAGATVSLVTSKQKRIANEKPSPGGGFRP